MIRLGQQRFDVGTRFLDLDGQRQPRRALPRTFEHAPRLLRVAALEMQPVEAGEIDGREIVIEPYSERSRQCTMVRAALARLTRT